MFYADLHIHSKYSRATGRNADLEHMAIWAAKKGVSVLGTGDFTHPEWMKEIRENLVPAEPGLFRLRDDLQQEVNRQVSAPCRRATRFMLEVEISTIYKKDDATRKVHHLIYVPDLDAADRLIQSLSRIGNLKSDGRPILGLDSRDLLEITLESSEGSYLVPAHIWTPWFAALGSKSGFDTIDHCYGDLAEHIFAVETGLSSDPPMNWRLSQLDRYTLVSNSDAHSPPKIGREACVFDCDKDYWSMKAALETGNDFRGTVEFFPEEGKYHLDGHRKCGVRLSPDQTRAIDAKCPECGKPLTVGVMNRVDSLADRPADYQPDNPGEFRSLIPLPEVISEIRGVGEKSKRVQSAWEDLVGRVGSELYILEQAPPEEIRQAGAPVVAEAVQRMRAGDVIRHSGYDGEYGVIRLFEEHELKKAGGVSLLFDLEPEPGDNGNSDAKTQPVQPEPSSPSPVPLASTVSEPKETSSYVVDPSEGSESGDDILSALDPDQRMAAVTTEGPVAILAGPGTGKTRTLTHRVAHLISDHDVPPEQCLTITFSRRAAEELRERLVALLPDAGSRVPAMTFHSLGLTILKENAERAGLAAGFRVASDDERVAVVRDVLSRCQTDKNDLPSDRSVRRAIAGIAAAKRTRESKLDDESRERLQLYSQRMTERDLVDFDDLILLPLRLLMSQPDIAAQYRERWPFISVDEFQDIDAQQYGLVRHLVADGGHICVIGDPDQSIYGFRGADAGLFRQFTLDYPSARTVQLSRNYRSTRTVVDAALQMIKPSTLVEGRALTALSDCVDQIEIQSCPTDKAEAEFVVHTVERLIGGSTFFSIDSARVASDDGEELSFGDFAVLYRTDAQADVLVEAFERSGMPFQRRSHSRLADQPTVAAIVEQMESAAATDKSTSVVDRLKQATDAVWESHADASDWLAKLHPIAERHGADLNAFLTELALGLDADLWDPRADRVSLLSIHASKGLEFPVVFVVGCEDGVIPLQWGSGDDANTDEERRLLFVGMTRACHRLYLSHAARRHWRGKPREMAPSPFLRDIENELLRRESRQRKRRKKSDTDSQLQLFS